MGYKRELYKYDKILRDKSLAHDHKTIYFSYLHSYFLERTMR